MSATDSRQIERTAAAWLARRDGEAWGDADEAALQAWLAAATAHRVAFVRLEAAWEESARLKALAAGRPGAAPPPRAYAPEVAVVARRAPLPARRGRLAAAAAIVVIALGALGTAGLHAWRAREAARPVAYATAVGRLDSVRLSDGSEATLSSDSRIAVSMAAAERRIDLLGGEAFFEVAKDHARPFVVDADGRRAIAVGTRFSVRRQGDALRVVVTEGVVRLESPARPGRTGAEPVLLPAGSIAEATRDGVRVRRGTLADAERALEWRGGRLYFDDTLLSVAAEEFNRYNERKLVMGDPEVAALRIGGNFRWSSPDAFARLLQQGFGVRVETRGDLLVLHSR
ncbi:MAG: FecR domain-containing protein [Xanthomonadales bacterium]|nr:FecR domain-containing protein [Xanthomonadales bacterium]